MEVTTLIKRTNTTKKRGKTQDSQNFQCGLLDEATQAVWRHALF